MERSIFRIIDANFNRAREAARVMEEFCRFTLNSKHLSGRAKILRHQLSAGIGRLDQLRLIAARDSCRDVGASAKVQNQLTRRNLTDCFAAAAKRLTEALRALAETTHTINPELSAELEKLRFTAYTLEKDITLFADAQKKFARVRLYIVITSSLPGEVLPLTHHCIKGGADCIQLRAKDLPDDRFFALAKEFVGICASAGVLSIINDRADIAIAAEADGLHLGQNDLPIDQVRRLELTPLIIGKSTHSTEQLETAISENPTYVSLGPVFPTPTKPDAPAVGLDYVKHGLERLKDTGIGHVAIGGITPDNIDQILAAGAKTIAVCSAVTHSPDPTAACKTLKQKLP